MRCKICLSTVKHAGKITRKRRICGECVYASKALAKSINTSNPIQIQCKTKNKS